MARAEFVGGPRCGDTAEIPDPPPADLVVAADPKNPEKGSALYGIKAQSDLVPGLYLYTFVRPQDATRRRKRP